jgi:N-methylhydantoinase A/oxoprolinase/acetone carboxylase beta subunit
VSRPDLRLGIDVGGTNTDAVIVDGDDRLLAKAKVTTSDDVTAGIRHAVSAVLGELGATPERITHAMLGTTHATNAILERRGLRRVAVVRIGAPATLARPPLATWPEDLRATVSVGEALIGGGFQIDGGEIGPLDIDALERFLESLGDAVEAVALVGVFSPVEREHELSAADVVRRTLGDIPVSLSHEIGTIGLLERENATVLNAALEGVAGRVAASLENALADHGLTPLVYFAQNDGTLMSLDYALEHPVLTIGSGPANSIAGAAHLTGLGDALVVDVGGTSTDIGALADGFPRESSLAVEIGGVANNFRMPDLVSVRLGGGTVVRRSNGGPAALAGEGVGSALGERALVFGGSTPTLTDAAVAGGRATLGDPGPALAARADLTRALALADEQFADAIGRAKTGRGDVAVVAVGGAGFLMPDGLPGVRTVIRPDHAEVANAIGAALAKVGGRSDRVVTFRGGGRQAALDEACEAARMDAVRAGADPLRTEIVEIEELPFTYLPELAVRVRVRAAGPLGDL